MVKIAWNKTNKKTQKNDPNWVLFYGVFIDIEGENN